MKHTYSVQNYLGNHRQLAEEIGDLYYDSLAELLRLLADKIERDGDNDNARGRHRLGASLTDCARHLQQAAEDIDRAWEICRPFVK